MANLSDYTTGTITVAANGTTVTGVGTSWATLPAFKEGDWFIANGWVNIVQSVDSNTQLTLAMPWRGGALTAQPYRLRYMSDGSRTSAMTKALLELLGGSGSLEALAALSGLPDHIPIFSGPGVMTLIPRSELIDGVKFDAQVPDLAGRAAYNGQPEGFVVLVSDNGDGRSAIYSRIGAAGNWSAPAFLTGPQGEANFVGTSTSSVASTTGNKTFTIAEPNRSWGVGQRLRASRTATPTQFVEGVVVSYTGNTLVLNVLIFNGSGSHNNWTITPVGEPGTMTGVTPFWNTRLSSDTTATQAQTGLGASATGRSLFTATNAAAARTAAEAVGYTAQTLTAPQKVQARNNIGAQEDLGWRPIQIIDVASSVAAIVVAIPSGIQHIRFSGRVKTSVLTAATLMRVGTSASSFFTSGYVRAVLFQVAAEAIPQGNVAEGSFIFAYENGDAAFPTQIDAQLDIGPSPWYPKFFQRSAAYQATPPNNVLALYHGWYTGSVIPTHLQIYPNSGNIAPGTKILIEGM